MALKDSWKKTGTEFGHAFKDLGKAFAHTAKDTIKKVDNWANKEEEAKPEPTIVEEGSTEKPEKPQPVIVEE